MSQIDLETRKKMGISNAKSHFEHTLIPMFERAYANETYEFRLVLRGDNFYIHPLNKNGETVDISWAPADPFCEDVE